MAKIELTSYAFNGGELDPAMQARVDYQKYATGAAEIVNMIPRPTGGVWRRPGSRFVAEAKGSSRLIPFRFSVLQSYVLEFGDRTLRVIMNDGLVEYPKGHAQAGKVVEIVSPYAAADLKRVTYRQTADVMFLAHPNYPLHKLMRYGHHDWRFMPLSLGTALTPAPTGIAITADGRTGKKYAVTAVNAKGDESYSSSVASCTTAPGLGLPMPDVDNMKYKELYDWMYYYQVPIPSDHDYYRFIGGDYYKNDYFDDYTKFLLGRGIISRIPLWEQYNSDEWPVIYYSNGWEPHLSRKQGARGNAWMGEYVDTTIQLVDGGLYGSLDALRKAIRNHVEASGKTSLRWSAAAGAIKYRVYRQENVEGKGQLFAYVGETTATTFTDDNLNYDSSKGMTSKDWSFAVPGDFPGAIAIFNQRLIVGRTDNRPTTFWGSRVGSWETFTQQSPIVDDDAFMFELNSEDVNEIAWMTPLNSLLIGTGGSEWRAGGGSMPLGPKNPDVNCQSNFGCAVTPAPLVVGRSVVFAARSRRLLRDFQYSLEEDGFSGNSLTMLVEHLFGTRHIVDMCYQQEPESVVYVVMSDGALLSCTYLPGQNVVAWARHQTDGKYLGCVSLVNVDGSDRVYFLVKRTVLGVERFYIEVMDSSVIAGDDVAEMFYVDCGLTYRGTPTSRIAGGLEHLEGKTVFALADGVAVENLTVKNGGFSLPQAASVIHVGLPYESVLTTLDLEPAAQGGGTIRHRARNVVAVTPTLMKTVNGELAIVSKHQTMPAEWTPLLPQSVDVRPDRPQLFTGETKVIPFPANVSDSTRVSIRCSLPTPMAVLGMVAEGDVGDA